MYNRYIPNGTSYAQGRGGCPAPLRAGPCRSAQVQAGAGAPSPQGERPGTGRLLLSSLLKRLQLEDLDTGDILLLLILLFLFIDGDDLELLITLALLILLGLGKKEKEPSD